MDIVVLAGGLSTERDVSFSTGSNVAEALRELGHRVILLDVFMGYSDKPEDLTGIFGRSKEASASVAAISSEAPDLEAIRKSRKDQSSSFFGPNVVELCRMADIVFMALHGENGEDGRIQAAFDLYGIKYTGTGYLSSAIAMDKDLSKRLFAANGIPTPAGISMEKGNCQWDFAATGLTLPCVVKPCCGGSSIGVSIVRTKEEYQQALKEAFRWEEKVIIENYIQGREFSVGVMDFKALPVIEIAPLQGFYDYKNKYAAGSAVETCPADLPQHITEEMQHYAEEVAKALGLETYARMDFLLDGQGQVYCLEANTLPGMTKVSLLPQEAQAVGMDFGSLCEEIIRISMKKYEHTEHMELEGMTLENIAKACKGTYFGGEQEKQKAIRGAVTDSRQVEEGFLFIPIKGAKADGHDFIPDVFAKGAAAVLSEKKLEGCKGPYILVESSEQALKDIAEFYRGQLSIPVVGITGSVGKTSTKEMIASVLSQKYQVLKTAGNFNNEIGLPLTLLRIQKGHEAAVVEMGISDFGEMHRLAKMARPDICVITNIGICHLENLKTRDGILKAKSEIFDFLKPEGRIILNGEDDKLSTLKEVKGIKPVFYGFGGAGNGDGYGAQSVQGAAVQQEIGVGSSGDLDIQQEGTEGYGSSTNAHTILPVGIQQEGTEGYGGRIQGAQQDIYADNVKNCGLKGMDADIHTPEGTMSVHIPIPGQHTIYNAMAAAGVGLALGMGENEKQLHYEVGAYAAGKQIDTLFCAGPLSEEIARGAREANDWCEVFYFPAREEMVSQRLDYLLEGDTVLVTASHFMDYPKVIEAIKERIGV